MRPLQSFMILGLGVAVSLMCGRSASGAGGFPQPTINDRASWNARPPQGSISTMSGLDRAVIHHTAISTDYDTTGLEDSKAKVRSIQNFHMDVNGWSDIGYHFLADKFGNNFEGRENSLSGLPRGAHDGVNNNSMGFSMMGYFHTPYNDQPTLEHRNAIYDMIAWKVPDPFDGFGSGPYGSQSDIGFVAGHRNVSATACPGDLMYNQYIGGDFFAGEARTEINARITGGSSGGTEIILDNDDGSPTYTETGGWSTSGSTGYNGLTYRFAQTGDPNTATWTANLPEAGEWTVDVIYRAGTNRPTAARYEIAAASGTQEAFVDQTQNNLIWVNLGTWQFNAGTATVTLDALGSTPSGQAVIADAVRFTSSSTGGGTDPEEMRVAVITVFDDINDTQSIQAWVDDIASLNYNAIAIHTRYRGDATYFPNKTDSTFPNNEPRNSAAGSIDVLEEFTTRGHAAGLKVLAYVNTHLVTDGANSDPRSNHVVNEHPEWRTYAYNGGNPVVQDTSHDGEGLWLDAALPGVQNDIANICGDIMMNYDCDGIVLDRIRYPQTTFTRENSDFGYHPDAIAAFNAQFGKSGIPDPYDSDWILFRQEAITTSVAMIYSTITAIDPNHILVAFPIGRFNDAVNFNYQDWPTWLNDQAIDGVLPQIYTSNNTTFASRCDEHLAAYSGERLLGVSLMAFQSGVDLAGQIQITRDKGFDGTSPFRHGTLDTFGYRTDLQSKYVNPAPWPAMPWKSNDTTAPAAPANLLASAGDAVVDLDWDDNGEADLAGYNVYRSTTSGGPYSQINGSLVTASAFSDSAVTNGTTYYYVVTAVDTSSNESTNSNEASATPVDGPPAAPTGLAATGGDSVVDLDWNDNSESDLASYSVYRSTTSGGPYSSIATGVASSAFSDNTVTNGTTYYYVVTAVDAGSNESANSNEASATPDVPSDIINLAASDFSTAEGSVIGSYVDTHADDGVYEQIVEGESGGKPSNRFSTASHTWTFAVASGASYSFEVQAHHTSNGEGDNFQFSYSTDNSSYTPMLTVTKTADDGAYQTFSFPGSVAGTLYVRVEDTDSTPGNRSIDTLFVDHMFVRTVSSGGADTTPPNAPTNLAALGGDGVVDLDWDDNVESDLAGYNVYRSTSAGGPYTQLNGSLITSSAFSDASVTNGTTYFYVVTAVDNSSNESADSNEASATPQAGGGGSTMHVGSIVLQTVNIGGGNKLGEALVTVVDSGGSPVAGANVTGTFTGSYNESQSATTGSDGVATITTSSSVKGGVSFTFCVDDVTHSSLTYDSGSNAETCDSI